MAPPTSHRARKTQAILLNLIAPGAGLVILRREWLGLAITLLFVVVTQLAIWGLFVVPAAVPRWFAVSLVVAAGIIWLSAQWLGMVRARRVLGEESVGGLRILCERAGAATEAQRFSDARDLLLLAMTINDEDPQVRHQWALLMTVMGRFGEASRAWIGLLNLSPDDAMRREAIQMLERLPRK